MTMTDRSLTFTNADIAKALDDLVEARRDLLYDSMCLEGFDTVEQPLKAARRFDDGIETRIDEDFFRALDLLNEAIATLERHYLGGSEEDRNAFAEETDLTVGPMDATTWERFDTELRERLDKSKGRQSKRLRALTVWRSLCRDCAQHPEFYVVTESLWQSGFHPDEIPTGCLCLNCLERRLGRWLADDEIANASYKEFDQQYRIRRAQRPLFGDHQELVELLDEAVLNDEADEAEARRLGYEHMPEPDHWHKLDDIAVARRWLPRLTPLAASNAFERHTYEGDLASWAIIDCWREQKDP